MVDWYLRYGQIRRLTRGSESWELDSDAEFFAEYDRGFDVAQISRGTMSSWEFDVAAWTASTTVYVQADTRAHIENVFRVFEDALDASRLPEPPPAVKERPKIFIGHGSDPQWRDLADQLRDHHGYEVWPTRLASEPGT
jgi:hypothetical protein